MDYIRRDILIRNIENDTRTILFCKEDALKYVRNALAEDVAPVRHGRWVRPHWRNSVSSADCSECGAEAHHAEYRGVQKYYKNCPSCGARMDKETDHEI